MLNSGAFISDNVFNDAIEQAPTRDGFGHGVVEAGSADLSESTRAEWFQKEFPERYIEVGIAEQNMAALASGLSSVGKIPFAASYAAFNPGRNYEHIRTTIALNQANVKICGMHAGVSVGPDGATHQMLEDIGLMRMLPGMTVLVPGDAEEARKAVVAAASHTGPVYIRFGRSPTPVFTTPNSPYEIGKALMLWESESPRVTFCSTGAVTYTTLVAAQALSEEGIGSVVLHVPTVKPLDAESILDAARRTGHVITVEEHQVMGGFGSSVAELLGERHPVPVHRIGVQDQFGQSGEPEQLLAHYGLDALSIQRATRAFLGA
jgi:transketolase